MNFKITTHSTDESLLSIYISGNVYTGGTSGCLTDRSNDIVLFRHQKSITDIKSWGDYIGCASYDCTVSIFKDGLLFDLVEGPDTEIKSLAFSEDGKFLALSTRGKSVWLCRFGEYIEIDKILEDHSEDVKGCRFHNSYLFTYGYDSTLKIYQYFEYSESYEMVQDIHSTTGYTIWDILLVDDSLYVACDSGEIIIYSLEKGWVEKKRVKLSHTPLYSICRYRDCVVVGVNGGNLVFLDLDLNLVKIIEHLHSDAINCIYYSEEDKTLATCSDDQTYCLLQEEYQR